MDAPTVLLQGLVLHSRQGHLETHTEEARVSFTVFEVFRSVVLVRCRHCNVTPHRGSHSSFHPATHLEQRHLVCRPPQHSHLPRRLLRFFATATRFLGTRTPATSI
jgi:hypothetical protein